MKTAILCVGKLKERYFRDASDEYTKRLSRYGSMSIIECADIAEPHNASAADIARIMQQEGQTLLAKLLPRDRVIALCIGGKTYDSPAFARRISALEDSGTPRTVFVIGGSNGLSPDVLQRADETLSFSQMTFPHQLARIMLLEQIYRARKILSGETYHK